MGKNKQTNQKAHWVQNLVTACETLTHLLWFYHTTLGEILENYILPFLLNGIDEIVCQITWFLKARKATINEYFINEVEVTTVTSLKTG